MIDCADVVDACLEKFGQHELEGMSEQEQIVTLLFNLEYDIVSSGMSNFLWREQFVKETLFALRKIELFSVAFNLERLLALHQKRRREELTQPDELLKRELEKFFYATEDVLHERLCTFIERNWPQS